MSSSSKTSEFRVAIIGGGLGGLALAIGLRRNHVRAHVYEAAAQFSEIGAGVVFGANAIRALGLIDPALLAAYRKHATQNPPGAWLTYRYGMALRKGAPERGLRGEGEAGQVFWQQYDHAESGYVHRARLLDEMVGLVPAGTASFNKKLARVEEAPDGGLILFFADGTTAAADAVVGCDGIRSSTRAFVCGHAVQPAYSGQYAYRHLFPRDVAIAALGPDRALGMTLECGYGGYIIHYPVEGGSLVNMTAVRSDGSSGWSGDTWLEPTSREAMLEDWRGWDARLLELMARVDRPERRALFDLRHGAGYARGRVCLLGDSAHATTPHNGAGAAMAMEDAYVLSGLLAEVSCLEDLDSAFKAYDTVRRPRTQRLIENSRLTGFTKSFMCTGVWDVPEKIRAQLDFRYRWIWEVNLEKQLDDAKTLMRDQARAHPSL